MSKTLPAKEAVERWCPLDPCFDIKSALLDIRLAYDSAHQKCKQTSARVFDSLSVNLTLMMDLGSADPTGDAFVYLKPMQLFETRKYVKICAPMVRYSK